MASTSPAEIALLHELVAIPSVSGDEEAIARFIEGTVRGWGLDVVRDTTGVKVELRARKPGPTLALVSHVDVVPPGHGWTRDPWIPVVEDGRLTRVDEDVVARSARDQARRLAGLSRL